MVQYCPNGHGEFDDWVTRCPECRTRLVDAPPPAPNRPARRSDEPIVYLATAPNEITAQMWLEALRDAGIRAMAKPLGPGMGAWASVATMEHALYVLQSHYEEARDLISGIEGIGFDDDVADSPFTGRRR
ncbi:MAG TPA: hypothetical protein VFL82_13230 [Thermomicrobiales bacterium]|nr:hypothetical protein [Thermomicrobiales bacterium]